MEKLIVGNWKMHGVAATLAEIAALAAADPAHVTLAVCPPFTLIDRAVRSVGRVELLGHPDFEWVGTAWVVAENVVAAA